MSGEVARRSPSGLVALAWRDLTLNPANIVANTTLDVVVAAPLVPEAEVGDQISVQAPALEAGLGIVNAFCHVAGGITFRIMNATVGAIDPASQTFNVMISKKGPTF